MLLLIAMAHATEVEEIVVFGDPLSPWDGTRWWVAAETVSHGNPLQVSTAAGNFIAPAWQVSAVLACSVVDHRRRGGWVECTPEQVALRAASTDAWQRPADRRMVDAALAELAQQLEGAPVKLRIRGQGEVRVGVDQTAAGGLAAQVMKRALAGFHMDLPGTGLSDGARWTATDEPLLALDAYAESFGLEQVVHYCDSWEDQWVVQSLAEATKWTVVGTRRQDADTVPSPEQRFLPEWRPMEEDEVLPPIELLAESQVRMDAVAVVDPDLGYVTERVWSMRSTGAVWMLRSGGVRLLEEGESVDLGHTGQVAPPRRERPTLPPWTPVHPTSL